MDLLHDVADVPGGRELDTRTGGVSSLVGLVADAESRRPGPRRHRRVVSWRSQLQAGRGGAQVGDAADGRRGQEPQAHLGGGTR